MSWGRKRQDNRLPNRAGDWPVRNIHESPGDGGADGLDNSFLCALLFRTDGGRQAAFASFQSQPEMVAQSAKKDAAGAGYTDNAIHFSGSSNRAGTLLSGWRSGFHRRKESLFPKLFMMNRTPSLKTRNERLG